MWVLMRTAKVYTYIVLAYYEAAVHSVQISVHDEQKQGGVAKKSRSKMFSIR